jgi:hypothetical protein
MTTQQIRSLSPRISEYLDEFADCFVTFDSRYHLKEYVQGQLGVTEGDTTLNIKGRVPFS